MAPAKTEIAAKTLPSLIIILQYILATTARIQTQTLNTGSATV